MKINIIPSYDVGKIILNNYNRETKEIILSNLKKYTKLKKFICYYCNLTELPDLPNSLQILECNYNNLIKLSNLPNSLKELYCFDNNLIELPNSLIELSCQKNNLVNEFDKSGNSVKLLL